MIAALIFVISLAALLQFFVSYCRSVIAASSTTELSQQARELAGAGQQRIPGDEFGRLLQLAGLCPEPRGDRNQIRAVRIYYRLVNVLRGWLGWVVPSVVPWAEREREGCAYFAAVALDRRIAYSRELMAQQIANR